MAEQDVIKKLNAKLECSICLDSFKQPKLLPCYHVFCESPCLKELSQATQNGRSLTCPICRHIVPLSERGVAELQTDFHIDHLFEIRDALNKSAESAKTQCGNCDKKLATGYCQECQDFLCDECQSAHHTLKMTQSHKMINLREFQQQAIKIITAKKMVPICRKHSNNELKIYCDTCKELICYDCIIRLHKDHSCDPVTDVFLKHKQELVSSLKPLKQKLNKVQQSLKVFDNLAKDIHNQRVSLIADINKEIDELQHFLDQHRTKLVDEVEMRTVLKLEALTTQRKSVEMTQVKLSSCLEYAEGVIETGTQCQVLEMKAPVLERVKHISNEFDVDSLCPKINSFTKLIVNDKEQLQETQKSCLKLHTVSHDTLNTSVSAKGLTHATVNEEAKLELSADTYPSLIDATVTDCRSHKTIKCQVSQSDNKHQITYTPTNRGKHEISLTIYGTHIRGSPFTVVVMPQPHTLGVPSRLISKLKRPWGVVVNSKGHVIVAERGSGQIVTYNENYKQIQAFNSGGNAPVGVTVDGVDNIYVSDREKHIVQKFTATGQFLLAVGTKGNQRLHFDEPCELAYNKCNEKIYVSDHLNNRVQVLNTDLTFHSIININQPDGVAFDSIGNAYIASYKEHNVMVCDSNGKLLRKFGTQGSGSRQLTAAPLGIAICNTDIVYVAEMDGHCISIFRANGEFVHSFGKNGIGKGQFKKPAGVAIDSNGCITVTDRENGRIQVF